MSKRLQMLEQLASSEKADAFTLYALALEYRSSGRIDDALRAFQQLRRAHPDYVPQYLMAGAMLQAVGRAQEARDWIIAGVEKAREKGEHHAQSELSDMLEAMGD